MEPTILTSGDLIADRRYAHGADFCARGDYAAAVDLFRQAAERAPDFAAAWYGLGDACQRLGDRNGAAEAFARARAADPQDRQGAALRLARLGRAAPEAAMTPDYVRAVFDQHPADFDRALVEGLGYRGPQLLAAAVATACAAAGRAPRFARALDLGCGTGLAGAALRPWVDHLAGVDLSLRMLELAARRGCYDALATGEMLAFLRDQPDAGADLVLAADALVYVAELGPLCREVARVLARGGLFAFTVETHTGQGIVLGEKLRYAHAEPYVRAALTAAGLGCVSLAGCATRCEAGAAVPGLLAVARREPGRIP